MKPNRTGPNRTPTIRRLADHPLADLCSVDHPPADHRRAGHGAPVPHGVHGVSAVSRIRRDRWRDVLSRLAEIPPYSNEDSDFVPVRGMTLGLVDRTDRRANHRVNDWATRWAGSQWGM